MICRPARAGQSRPAGMDGPKVHSWPVPRPWPGSRAAALYRGNMRARTQPARPGLALRVAAVLAVAGLASVIASLLIAYLVADHSSSDSSPSSLAAIGLAGAGLLLILLSVLLLIGGGLARVRRRRP